MRPMPEKKPSGPRDFVGEELEAMKGGKAKHGSVEDLLLAALRKLSEAESVERLGGYQKRLRGEVEPQAPMATLEADEDRMPPECESGECEHPEHQHEDALPEDI